MPFLPVSHYTRKPYVPLSKRVDDDDYDSDEEVGTHYRPIIIDTTSDESGSDRDNSPSESSDSEPEVQPRRLYAGLFPAPFTLAPAPVASVVVSAPAPAPAQECWMCGSEWCRYAPASSSPAPSPAQVPVAPALPSSLPRLETIDEILSYFN